MATTASSPVLFPVVGEVLDEFHRTHGHHARLWVQRGHGAWHVAAQSAPTDRTAPAAYATPISIPAPWGFEARLEVDGPEEEARSLASFLVVIVGRLVRYEVEARLMGEEMAERYEEISLIYSISEILGSVISLDTATDTILSEVARTLGVQRATLWLHNPERGELDQVASVGAAGQADPVRVTDRDSVTATVFRERRPIILEPADEFPRGSGSLPHPRASLLSVPVNYTPPEGESRTIGVINLGGLGGGESFSAGNQKLISAIASQIGAAVENSRLVAASLRQERLVREMELAHDLQLKLLPPLGQFEGIAEVAARCVPAESVGGDFYHLFRMSGGRLGVMIGDVSSHGFGAALIMALTMSAAAIHASEEESPGEVLRRVHRTLVTELETTEMYLTLFYAVIDPRDGEITYANAGHSHAFHVTGDGEVTRLGATNPPLGMVDLDEYSEGRAPWRVGEDFLFLFTDGLSDALGLGEVAGERTLLAAVAESRAAPLAEILARVFEMGVANDLPADDRTAVLVRL